MPYKKLKRNGLDFPKKEELLGVSVFVVKEKLEIGGASVCLRDAIFIGGITAFRVEKDSDGEERIRYTVSNECGETMKVSRKQLFLSEEAAFHCLVAKLLGAVCNAARYFGETRAMEDREGRERDVFIFDVKNERILDRDEYFNLD